MTGPSFSADPAGFDACSTAEDYLDYFGVHYDPRVVNVNRLHILRRFGERISSIRSEAPASGQPTEAQMSRLREALVESYEDFVEAGSLDHRVFKVLRDAAAGCAVAVGAPKPRKS